MDLEVKASSACIELRMLKAACKCWCAIVRSEKTHTLARNQCQVLMGFLCDQKRHTRWLATNAEFWWPIVRSETRPACFLPSRTPSEQPWRRAEARKATPRNYGVEQFSRRTEKSHPLRTHTATAKWPFSWLWLKFRSSGTWPCCHDIWS